MLELCDDSPFEREVGARLLELGFRARPQVEVGGFRIDFVVEGDGGRRIAVELDGDRYHGPDRQAADLHRQRALERMGWIFWRCWGSHWLADPEGCLKDLLATLAGLGIEPVGGSHSHQEWTEHRVAGGAIAPGDASQQAAAASGSPVLVLDAPAAEERAKRDDLSRHAQTDRDTLVEEGDTVIVRFSDDNRVRRFRLPSRRATWRWTRDPGDGRRAGCR